MEDLDIGRIARAQTGNNKVVIATRLSLTKSLHILSFLQNKWRLQHLVSEGERKLLWRRGNFRRGWAHGGVKPNSKLWTATFVSFSHLLVAGLICTWEIITINNSLNFPIININFSIININFSINNSINFSIINILTTVIIILDPHSPGKGGSRLVWRAKRRGR